MIETVLTTGGTVGVLGAIGYAGRLLLDWWRARQSEPRSTTTAAVSDAGAANSLLLASLRETQERETQLSGQVEELRAQNARIYDQMRQQRKTHDRELAQMRAEYEKEISELREQVDSFAQRLADLQERLHPDKP